MRIKKNLLILVVCLLVAGLSSGAYAGGSTPQSGYTQTKYPIVLVPGVLGFDSLLGVVDYFYGIEGAIEKTSGGQQVHLIGLSGWQETEARGLDLKNKIEALCAKYGYQKVNIIAHSHGSTTSRVAMKLAPNRIASLTTIAGPHQGTCMTDNIAALPSILKNTLYSAINLLGGDMVMLLSKHPEYVGSQNSQAALNDFTQKGIQVFNSKYPSAGLPKGGSYDKNLYGADATTPGAVAGDAFGNALSVSDPNAIRFYSWTGYSPIAVTHLLDPVDIVMGASDALNKLYGFWNTKTDCMVPVTSARFGQVICENYYWNHGDEINQAFGFLAWGAADPKEVFRTHVNRLKVAGL